VPRFVASARWRALERLVIDWWHRPWSFPARFLQINALTSSSANYSA
jgi:hypothetical protein